MSEQTQSPQVPRPSRLQRLALPAVVFVVGASSLGCEIAATRLLAPWFGASTVVWANTIATVLVALSLGYWAGGKIADRNATIRGLAKIVMLAAVLLALVPFVSRLTLDGATELFDKIGAGTWGGSMLALLLLVAVPVFVLGVVTPYAIKLRLTNLESAGTDAGRLYAISTIGSLVGVFLSALLLIPLVGTRRTFLAFALALALVALPLLNRRWFAVPALAALAFAVPMPSLTQESGQTAIVDKETKYQFVRVLQATDGTRTLEVGRTKTQHSVYKPGSYVTNSYWDHPLIDPWLSKKILDQGGPKSLLVLGNAAGTVARAYGHFYPQTKVDGVELDGEVSNIGRQKFDLHGPKLRTITADGRPFIKHTKDSWDVILVDVYRLPYVPFYMTTKEFFGEVSSRLNPGGVAIMNVFDPYNEGKLEKVLTATMRSVFSQVLTESPAAGGNSQLIASDGPLGAENLRLAIKKGLPREFVPLATEIAARTKPGITGGKVFTDDKAPIEWITDASILRDAL